LERGGSPSEIGVPVAFIESAWRRYTKHSRNKAQEIQGAILPLQRTHHRAAPFLGAVLAGVFTAGSVDQLRSLGFSVLHFPYDTAVRAFATVGINASYSEDTSDKDCAKKVKRWEALSEKRRKRVAAALVDLNREEVDKFIGKLTRTIRRHISPIRVLPLHGTSAEYPSPEKAINFIQEYEEGSNSHPFVKYEIAILFNNGDRIDAVFRDKLDAVQFLQEYQGPSLSPAV